MPSKAKGERGEGNGGDGGKKKKKKTKKSSVKGERCSKCETLFPIMYKMKDLLATLQPQCNQYRRELAAVRAENENLRRQLRMLPVSTPSPGTAPLPPPGASASASRSARTVDPARAAPPAVSTAPVRKPAAVSSATTAATARGGGGGGGRGTALKERSKGEKLKDWTAAVARQKRERPTGAASETAGDRVGGADGGDGDGSLGSGDEWGGGGGGRGEGGRHGDREGRGEGAGPTEMAGGAKKQKKSSGVGGGGGGSSSGGGKSGKGKGKGKKKKIIKEAALQPTGVFAAAEFSFLDDGTEKDRQDEEPSSSEEESEEEEEEEEGGRYGGTSSNNNNNHRKPRKRARGATAAGTTSGAGSSKGWRRGGAGGGGGSGSGPVPRTSSMLARGFQPQGKSDEVGGDDGVAWGEEEEEEEDVEWYEDSPNDMDGLGWSQVWRRSDAVAVGGRGVWGRDRGGGIGDGDRDGDGLDEGSRAMAQECCKLIDVADPAAAASCGVLEPTGLRALLRLELQGAVTMEGVLMAVLRGRSRAGDAGFLGRLALRLVEGIDAAHAKPPSDPDVLSPVVEELEGLADVLAAPSAPETKGVGWGRETRLALEFLSKTLLDAMDRAKCSGIGDAEGGDDLGGYASMSFGNSKRKKKKKKEKEMMMAKKLDTAKGGAEAAGGSAGEGEGGVREGDGVVGWTAEAEAPVMWWWETDDAARVPWGVARLLGLLLRRLDQPERTQAVLHSVLVRSLGGPSRLLRFPLAFLEAFPGFFLPPPRSPPTAIAAAAAAAAAATTAATATVADGVLAPGLWRRAVTAAMCPAGEASSGGGGVGGGFAVVAARFQLVAFGGEEGGGGGGGGGSVRINGDIQQGGKGRGGGGERDKAAAAKLAEDILQAICALHRPEKEGPGSGDKGGGRGRCVLCFGSSRDGNGNGDGGCGGDDALAMSTGLSLTFGERKDFPEGERLTGTTTT
ncbi:unnamed protein product [Pylaiella littoralis]